MPTSYSDQFWLIDPYAPPPVGTLLTMQNYGMTDADDDLDFSAAGGDTINGIDITAVYNGDTVTVRIGTGPEFTVTGATFYLADGSRVFTPTDGSVLQDATFVRSTWVSPNTQMDVADLGPPCFTPGTLIETATGPCPVEDIAEGDLVVTRDRGPQPVRWVSRRAVPGKGRNAPVRIRRGALGNRRDLVVSRQHRVLIEGWRAELLFGADEVFVSAAHLVDGAAIRVEPCREVTYLHLLFDRHEVIHAEGLPTESFDPGGDLVRTDPELRAALFARLPQMASRLAPVPRVARPVARAREARLLVA